MSQGAEASSIQPKKAKKRKGLWVLLPKPHSQGLPHSSLWEFRSGLGPCVHRKQSPLRCSWGLSYLVFLQLLRRFLQLWPLHHRGLCPCPPLIHC